MKNFLMYLKREFLYQEMILVYCAHMVSTNVYHSVFPKSYYFFIVAFSVVQVFFLIRFAEASRDERNAQGDEV